MRNCLYVTVFTVTISYYNRDGNDSHTFKHFYLTSGVIFNIVHLIYCSSCYCKPTCLYRHTRCLYRHTRCLYRHTRCLYRHTRCLYRHTRCPYVTHVVFTVTHVVFTVTHVVFTVTHVVFTVRNIPFRHELKNVLCILYLQLYKICNLK